MLFSTAHAIAAELVAGFAPNCERVEIAGSLRRKRPEIKDIEIIAIPKFVEDPAHAPLVLFASDALPAPRNALYDAIRKHADIRWIKPGTPDIVDWPIQPNGKYWRGFVQPAGIKLDLFLTTPDAWGAVFLIRTGSAQFSQAVATYAIRRGMGLRATGVVDAAGQLIPTPEERDVFAALAIPWIDPSDRHDGRGLPRAAEMYDITPPGG